MKTTDRTLLEQLKISKREIERRKEFLYLSDSDEKILHSLRELITDHIDTIVENF